MTLQASFSSSDPLCLSEIKTEFDNTSSDCLTGFYGVDSTPASGTICISDFLGTSQSMTRVATGGDWVGSAYTRLGYEGAHTGEFGDSYQIWAWGHGAGQTAMWLDEMIYTVSTSTLVVKFLGWVEGTHTPPNLLTTSASYPYVQTGSGGLAIRNAAGSELWAPTSASSYTWASNGDESISGDEQWQQTFTITNAQNGGSASSGAGFSVGDDVYIHIVKNSQHIQ